MTGASRCGLSASLPGDPRHEPWPVDGEGISARLPADWFDADHRLRDARRDDVPVALQVAADGSLHHSEAPDGTQTTTGAWLTAVGDHTMNVEALEPKDLALLVRAARGEALSNTMARKLLGSDAQEARNALQRLRNRGLLQQRGSGAGTIYALSPEITSPDGMRRVPRDDDAQVLEMARQGPVTNASVRARTGLGRAAVVQIFNRLVTSGRLERRGSRRGTHYVLATTESNHSGSADRISTQRK